MTSGSNTLNLDSCSSAGCCHSAGQSPPSSLCDVPGCAECVKSLCSGWLMENHIALHVYQNRIALTLYSAEAITVPHRTIWSWYTGRWWVGCYIWYSDKGTGRGWSLSPPRPLLAVPNVTAHPSTASVPITVLVYNGPLLFGFNVLIKG